MSAERPGGASEGGAARKFFLGSSQLGCPKNLDMTTQLHNWVLANGWSIEPAEGADVLFLQACSILVEYRRGFVRTVEYLSRRYPDKQIIVTCCYVGADEISAPNVSYVEMPRMSELDARFGAEVRLGDVSSVSTADEEREVRSFGNSRAVYDRPYNVMVSTGCLSRCTYCIEPSLFPKVESVPLEQIVMRCKEGLRKGYKNFLFGSTDVTSYGHDIGLDVTDLFAALFNDVFKGRRDIAVGFKAFEPSRVIRHFAKLKEYFATCRIDWIYLPIESGSDSVLQAMNRKYRVEDMLGIVRELKAVAPTLRIETDVIYCYPTETREDFEASLRLLEHFDHWNLVEFGRQENTKAAALPDAFSPEERARRCEIARKLTMEQVRSYRPECRTMHEVHLPQEPGAAERAGAADGAGATSLHVMSARLAAKLV